MKINEAVEKYLQYCLNFKRLDELTLKAYKIDINQFLVFLSSKGFLDCEISDLDKTIINDYINIIGQIFSPKSMKRKIASIKAMFNYFEFEDLISINPFRKIKISIKEPKRLPKSLTLFEIERILSYLYLKKSKSQSYYKNIAIFELLFATGMRVSELCNLKAESCNLEDQTIRIIGKGNKERIIYINNQYVLKAIENYLSLRPNVNEYFFINRLNQRLSEQSVRFFIEHTAKFVLNNKHVTPHMIRHSFATLMLEEGVDIKYIQNFLGHSSIMTTQIYTHSTVVKQKQIMLAFHPRNRIHAFE